MLDVRECECMLVVGCCWVAFWAVLRNATTRNGVHMSGGCCVHFVWTCKQSVANVSDAHTHRQVWAAAAAMQAHNECTNTGSLISRYCRHWRLDGCLRAMWLGSIYYYFARRRRPPARIYCPAEIYYKRPALICFNLVSISNSNILLRCAIDATLSLVLLLIYQCALPS